MNGIRYFYRTYIVQYVLEHKIAYGIRNSTKYEKSFRTERYTEQNGTEHMLWSAVGLPWVSRGSAVGLSLSLIHI